MVTSERFPVRFGRHGPPFGAKPPGVGRGVPVVVQPVLLELRARGLGVSRRREVHPRGVVEPGGDGVAVGETGGAEILPEPHLSADHYGLVDVAFDVGGVARHQVVAVDEHVVEVDGIVPAGIGRRSGAGGHVLEAAVAVKRRQVALVQRAVAVDVDPRGDVDRFGLARDGVEGRRSGAALRRCLFRSVQRRPPCRA